MRPLSDKYAYRVLWSEEDGEFVALCTEFPSLSWLAKTQERAIKGMVELVRRTLLDMAAQGETAPVPLATQRYSGVFKVRVPPSVHRSLAVQAAEDGVSLNRLVSAKLAS